VTASAGQSTRRGGTEPKASPPPLRSSPGGISPWEPKQPGGRASVYSWGIVVVGPHSSPQHLGAHGGIEARPIVIHRDQELGVVEG